MDDNDNYIEDDYDDDNNHKSDYNYNYNKRSDTNKEKAKLKIMKNKDWGDFSSFVICIYAKIYIH